MVADGLKRFFFSDMSDIEISLTENLKQIIVTDITVRFLTDRRCFSTTFQKARECQRK